MTSKAREVLLDAVEYIETHGWCQGGQGYGPNGQRCMLRAMMHSADHVRATMSAFAVAREAVAEEIGTLAIASWNDSPGRTRAEVVAKLRAAADKI